ncbi:hypothetical protein DRAZDYS_15 [Mycobacterium phage Drazdys]|uniref:Uncharacterized protein n=1 Tax=Mycobacterium phage Drazdys TaxID=1034132 RepID=G1BSR5_9CAUD|nr:hypothetical protein DRAZDYS_15 [Mycobacterium phage Drazdys]
MTNTITLHQVSDDEVVRPATVDIRHIRTTRWNKQGDRHRAVPRDPSLLVRGLAMSQPSETIVTALGVRRAARPARRSET